MLQSKFGPSEGWTCFVVVQCCVVSVLSFGMLSVCFFWYGVTYLLLLFLVFSCVVLSCVMLRCLVSHNSVNMHAFMLNISI
jgi:hypothetical protein